MSVGLVCARCTCQQKLMRLSLWVSVYFRYDRSFFLFIQCRQQVLLGVIILYDESNESQQQKQNNNNGRHIQQLVWVDNCQCQIAKHR